MAKKSVKENPITEENSVVPEEKSVIKENLTTEPVKVKFLSMLRGSYGAFNKGSIAEIDGKLAERLVKENLAEKV